MGVCYNGKVKKIPANTHSSCSDLGETALGSYSSHPNITIKKYMRLSFNENGLRIIELFLESHFYWLVLFIRLEVYESYRLHVQCFTLCLTIRLSHVGDLGKLPMAFYVLGLLFLENLAQFLRILNIEN